MNQEYTGSPFTHPEWYADAYWDPAEELASLLQGTAPADQPATVPPPRTEPAPGLDFPDPMEELARLTGQFSPGRRPPAGAAHRKRRVPGNHIKWMRAGSFAIAALVAVLVAMVSVFGGMAAYGPLRHATSGVNGGMIAWWPLLVYGPWMAASLSILRNALHQRRAVHSWCIVVLFSSVAMVLCVAQADRTVTGVAGAALPALASLACFQQLIRQITLTLPQSQERPRHGR
ncbi:DUF2637 domain-containing protein [Streptomyces sp. WELS2]|uniref:DUF2637 domain-containing protein n=1 Tax=Streptomyces sp. WELS2 TaxID=2749435 RepID=UPI00215D9AA2|nr:DUF2637 domain-containing protein [Streptomyces sp. WELS2]